MLAKMNIPAAILRAFKQRYPNTAIEEAEDWSDEAQFALNFWEDDIYKQVVFELDGTWVETNFDIEQTELPETVLDYIDEFYEDYNLELILFVEDDEGTSYIVGLSYGAKYLEITFDEEGSVLESNKEYPSDDDDNEELDWEDSEEDEEHKQFDEEEGGEEDYNYDYDYNKRYTSDDTMRKKRKGEHDSGYRYSDWN